MRVLWLIALGLVLVVGATLALTDSSSGGDPVRLRTAFESRRAAGWTSLAEEERFLRRLDASSRRVLVSTVGRSVQGRPIRLVSVGPARTRRQVAAGTSVLLLCAQHGDEPAGREACLQAARDAARGTDSTTVLVVPTANPDGVARAMRHNADGVDVNRDHARLVTPEARAIAAVIRDYRPDALGDFHEYPGPRDEVLLGIPDRLHLNVDRQVAALTAALNDRHVTPALRRAGFRTGDYQNSGPEPNEGVMRQQAALRHIPDALVETPSRGTLSPAGRVRAHRIAIRALVGMVRRRAPEFASSAAAAVVRARAEGAAGDQRYYYASPSTFSDRPPCGYRLTDEQYRGVDRRLALHGIRATRSGDAWNVSAAQAGQPMIGLLLDPRAPRKLTDGVPIPC